MNDKQSYEFKAGYIAGVQDALAKTNQSTPESLYTTGFEQGVEAERKKGKGMRWVKASERLPEKWGKKVIVRDLRTGAVSVEKNMGHYTAWGAGFLPFKETEWLDEGSTEQSGKEESPTAAGEMDELHRKSAELHSLKQSISESRLKDYFPTRDMSFHDKVVFAIDKATAAGDGKARETIEDILLKTGKHNPEQCSELADAILKDMKGAGDGKEDAASQLYDIYTAK